MPRKIPVSFAESAVRGLKELQVWYVEQCAPEAGQRLAAEIFQRIELLPGNPDMGRIVPQFKQPFLRELVHPPLSDTFGREGLASLAGHVARQFHFVARHRPRVCNSQGHAVVVQILGKGDFVAVYFPVDNFRFHIRPRDVCGCFPGETCAVDGKFIRVFL
ncbi:MAG: type II toxin-antitoxin system RelE/ParE family toxin [Acidobacteria bacterium]|nr:type II toxin-antitoxin system RelE/ParE family toxin [Acidobacteriota bacterium]